jgi:hypothetical protein
VGVEMKQLKAIIDNLLLALVVSLVLLVTTLNGETLMIYINS